MLSVTIPNITPSQNTPVLPNIRRIVRRPTGASCSRRNSAKSSLATILRPPSRPGGPGSRRIAQTMLLVDLTDGTQSRLIPVGLTADGSGRPSSRGREAAPPHQRAKDNILQRKRDEFGADRTERDEPGPGREIKTHGNDQVGQPDRRHQRRPGIAG